MSQREYLQEYAGIFISDLNQYFPDELIRRCMTLKRQERRSPTGRYYCGLDLARMGADLSVFSVIQKIDKDHLVQVESIATSKQLTTQTYNKLIELDRLWKFHQIYIDAGAGALGVVLFDFCLDNSQLKRKVVAINNRARPLDLEKAKSKILKEDLYNNLLNLMETKKIQLLDDEEIFLSLKSVQYEYVTKENQLTKLRIFGKYTHHAESIIRACCCTWDKTLNIWCR